MLVRKRKIHFFFKSKRLNNIARFIIRATHGNVFLTVTDMRNKVVTCGNAGSREYADLDGEKKHHKQ